MKDRTGESWELHGAAFLVVGSPDPWSPPLSCHHRAACLHDPKGRWLPGETCRLVEALSGPWETQGFARRIL